jgi:hypothetical protein
MSIAKNKFISEMGVDVPDRMPETKLTVEEMMLQKGMGFHPLEENMHGKSSAMNLPEHPRKES